MFHPFLLKKNITEITVEELREMGVVGLLLDVDNTLTAHDSQELSPAVADWLETVMRAGMRPLIVSNGKKKRVQPFAKKLGLPFTASAAKPLPFGFWRAARSLGLKRRQCVVIGDQIFTDVLGGKCAGIRVIQLLPLAPKRISRSFTSNGNGSAASCGTGKKRRKRHDCTVRAGGKLQRFL